MKLFISIYEKVIVVLILTLFCAQLTFSQEVKSDFWSHVRFGGGIGLSFGDGFFSGTIAPSAIYEFNQSFAFGFGLNATIANQKQVYKSTILGGSLIGLFNAIPELQLSAEFEEQKVSRKYDVNLNMPNDNYWSPALFLGAGYRNGNVTLGIRYDVLYDRERSIYSDPWMPFVRFYF